MQEGVGEDASESVKGSRMHTVFPPTKLEGFIQDKHAPDGNEESHGEPQRIAESHAVCHHGGRFGRLHQPKITSEGPSNCEAINTTDVKTA